MFAITGAGMSKLRHMANDGKPARHSVDQWDRVCFMCLPSPPSLLLKPRRVQIEIGEGGLTK